MELWSDYIALCLTSKDTTDEHLIALPPAYDNHPSVTGSIYKCRGVTRLPRPNMWDTTFLATIQWPPMESMDYIEPDVSENYKYLQEHNTSTREQLADYVQVRSFGNNTWGKYYQCKADRCLWTTPGLGVLIYVDNLLLVGETTKIQNSSSLL